MTPGTNLRVVKSNTHSNDLQRTIRARAYELFQQRGRQHGHDIEDWLRAEAELRANYGERTA
jgi:hypothetical protein